MSLWRQLEHGVRALANRRQTERDIDDELADYYRRAEAERMAGGLTPEEARRQTRLECGHPMVAGERLDGQAVTAGYFRTLGVPPIRGRDLAAGDDRLRGPRIAILSDSLWRRRFAADPAIVGRQVKLDGQDFAVIGVLPRRFENVVSPGAEIWSPLQYDATLPLQGREWGHHLRVLARLRPGVELSAAVAEIGRIAPHARRGVPPRTRLVAGPRPVDDRSAG